MNRQTNIEYHGTELNIRSDNYILGLNAQSLKARSQTCQMHLRRHGTAGMSRRQATLNHAEGAEGEGEGGGGAKGTRNRVGCRWTIVTGHILVASCHGGEFLAS